MQRGEGREGGRKWYLGVSHGRHPGEWVLVLSTSEKGAEFQPMNNQ
jgi:hypothetical protein